MKKVTLSVFALSLVFLATGCGDSPDSLMKDSIKWMNDTADILEKIKSKDDVNKYKSDLEKIAKEGKNLKDRGEKLKMKDLPKEKKEALEKKYKSDAEKAVGRLVKAMTSVPPDARKAIDELKLDVGGGPF